MIGLQVRTLKLKIAWAAVLIAFLPLGARAQSALYAAANPVPDQSVQARAKALRQDLATVFVKVSGNPDAASSSALAPALAQASQLVSEYRYQEVPPTEGGGLALWASFDADKVNAALGAAGEPIWGRSRPRVIAWVLAPAGMVGDDSTNPLSRSMQKRALKRGLPLVLPLLDIADRKAVSGFDIQSFYLPALKQASQRYGAQAMLIGTIQQSGKQVSSHWRLVLGDNTNDFAVPAPSPASAAAAAVGMATTELAGQFARLSGSGKPGLIALTVANVDRLQAETRVRRAVADVQGVKQFQLVRVTGDALHFVVTYAGAPKDFARDLSLSGILTQSNSAPVATSASFAATTRRAALRFRYTP
ncbi:MAG: DUF2066 domain-containing protein [Gammaproteobacteria bacterium]